MFGTKGDMKFAMPMKLQTEVTYVGRAISDMASVLLGSGRVPPSECLTPMEHLSSLNTRPYSVARFQIQLYRRRC